MNKENYLHFIASFMIVLVLSIPFYAASANAEINTVSARGGDGIEGFVRAEDFIDFVINAFISGETIAKDQVFLGSDIIFDSCRPNPSLGSECKLRYPSQGKESFEGAIPYTVTLYKKDKKTKDAFVTDNILVDNKAPQVKLIVSQKKFSSNDNVVVYYEINDFACDDIACEGKCVGLKNIEFFTSDGSLLKTTELNTDKCLLKDNVSFEPSIFIDGKNSIFAKASDRFNQISQENSVTFDVDASAPTILSDSFSIIKNGISLSAFSQFKVPVEIVVNISATDLVKSSVTANLSSLNPSQDLKNAKGSCVEAEEGINTCRWSIDLNPINPGLKTVVIQATDTSGNRATALISKLLSLDDKGPVVQSLSSQTVVEARNLVRAKDNTITAVFDEATGLSNEQVFLNTDNSKLKASRCIKEESWVCAWDNVNFASSTKISIKSDTTDILGNPVTDGATVDVTLDTQTPVLNSINISPVPGINQEIPGIFKIGDKIAVIANLSEENQVFATADFSKFISDATQVAGSCERVEGNEHRCIWLTDSINLQANSFITFNFSDSTGNTLIATRALKTFGLENAPVPDFWRNEVSCSPKTIDRQIGPLINQREFCQVELIPRNKSSAETVFIGQAECLGDTSLIQRVDTFNTQPGSTAPVIKLTLKKDKFDIDRANLTCSFSIFSKVHDTITKNPEIENVHISILFSNLPLGEVSEEVQRKIDDAKKYAKDTLSLIGTFNKLIEYSKRICQIINTVYNVVALLYTVAFLLKLTNNACSSTGILAPICAVTYGAGVKSCVGQQGAHTGAQNLRQVTDKFCKYVNCEITILWGPYMQNLVNNAIPLAGYIGPKTTTQEEGLGIFKSVTPDEASQKLGLKPISSYMDPQHNLIVATAFACLPGIVYGLDKYRQIQCLYADCLQNAVAREGLPVTACEDQKAYATCKYVTGEIFALIPYTAVLDHFLGLIKNALSNPFGILGVVVGAVCVPTCPEPTGASYSACEFARLFNSLGDVIQNTKSIIDNGFQIRADYCSRLDNEEST